MCQTEVLQKLIFVLFQGRSIPCVVLFTLLNFIIFFLKKVVIIFRFIL